MMLLIMLWIIGSRLCLGPLFWAAWWLKLADVLLDWLIRLGDRRERKRYGKYKRYP